LVSRECLCSLPIGKREHSNGIFQFKQRVG
jgi:hypothetical protein